MKIVLIGFMGSGKTTVAPILADKLGLEAIEMDDLIIVKAGGKSIADIFKAGGEPAFRELEAEGAHDLRDRDNTVISTGGGAVTNEATINALSTNATVIGLDASFDTVLSRVSPGMPRPLFQDQEEASSLYEQRKPLYSSYATIHISTDNKSANEVAAEIIDKVKPS